MTIEEAIKYAENMAILSHKGSGNTECEHNHRQLAEWLKELQTYRNRECETCKNSENGKCAGTEECHECMWQNQYEQEPCEDCISRKAACDAIRKYKSVVSVPDEYDIAFDDGIDTAIAEIGHNVPSVIPKPKMGWIPVSERLPNDRRPVLVTAYWHETYQVMMASYFGDGLWWCVPFNNCGKHEQKLNPKAWLPLPEPYKAERNEEK